MSQVTGKKVAVTPMPTPTGTSGAIIDSFNTQDDQTVNAPSIHIVKDALTTINDNLTSLNNSYKIENGEPMWSADGGNTWENFSSGAVLLWTNSAPTSSFSSQTISLDLTDYEYVVVVVKTTTGDDTKPRGSVLVKVDDLNSYNLVGVGTYTSGVSTAVVGVKASTTGVTFTVTNSSRPIPLYILGIKKLKGLASYIGY